MTHPEEQLAGYIDGSLTETERAEVDAHLATCATCREEVELAGRAVSALRDLPEEPVPVGVTGPVLTEIGAKAPSREPSRAPARAGGHRFQWAAGLAAAAVLVAAVAVALPKLSQQGTSLSDNRAAGASPTAQAPGAEVNAGSIQLETQAVNYDAAKLEQLADQATRAPADMGVAAPNVKALSRAAATAEVCLAQPPGGITARDRIVRLIQATYQGTAAYLGVYRERPKSGGAADRIVIWVVAKDGCGILSFASKQL